MDPAVFVEVVQQPEMGWKMFKDLLEVFHGLQVAPERDFEYH